MKKLLLIIALLICQVAIGQKNVSVISPTRYAGEGTPYFKKNVPAQALYINYLNDSVYQFARWSDLNGRWNLCTDIKAINDIRGSAGVKGEKGDTGPQGPKGDPGVCPVCPPSGGTVIFPFIVLQPSGGDDTQMWRNAIALAKVTRRAIYPFGTFKISGELTADLDHYNLAIIGNQNARLLITTSDPITVIKRRSPVNNSEALNIGTFAKWLITGITIQGFSNQIGIDCGPQYNANISNNYFDGLKRGIWAKFALWSKFTDNMFVNCYDGIIVDIGDWLDATNFNSQSNSNEVSGRYYGNSAVMAAIREAFPNYREQLRQQFSADEGDRVVDVYSQILDIVSQFRVTSGGVAFGFYGVSGGWLHDFIVEGVSAGAAVDFDGLGSSVVKDFTVERGHIEMVQGFSTSAINLRILGGTMTVSKIFGQYPSLFMKAESGSGLGYVEVSHVPWWVPKSGKYFNTTNISQHYYKNEAFRSISSSMWEGTAPTSCMPIGSTGCGYNKYTYIDIPR